jgi:hypothetical protein
MSSHRFEPAKPFIAQDVRPLKYLEPMVKYGRIGSDVITFENLNVAGQTSTIIRFQHLLEEVKRVRQDLNFDFLCCVTPEWTSEHFDFVIYLNDASGKLKCVFQLDLYDHRYKASDARKLFNFTRNGLVLKVKYRSYPIHVSKSKYNYHTSRVSEDYIKFQQRYYYFDRTMKDELGNQIRFLYRAVVGSESYDLENVINLFERYDFNKFSGESELFASAKTDY